METEERLMPANKTQLMNGAKTRDRLREALMQAGDRGMSRPELRVSLARTDSAVTYMCGQIAGEIVLVGDQRRGCGRWFHREFAAAAAEYDLQIQARVGIRTRFSDDLVSRIVAYVNAQCGRGVPMLELTAHCGVAKQSVIVASHAAAKRGLVQSFKRRSKELKAGVRIELFPIGATIPPEPPLVPKHPPPAKIRKPKASKPKASKPKRVPKLAKPAKSAKPAAWRASTEREQAPAVTAHQRFLRAEPIVPKSVKITVAPPFVDRRFAVDKPERLFSRLRIGEYPDLENVQQQAPKWRAEPYKPKPCQVVEEVDESDDMPVQHVVSETWRCEAPVGPRSVFELVAGMV